MFIIVPQNSLVIPAHAGIQESMAEEPIWNGNRLFTLLQAGQEIVVELLMRCGRLDSGMRRNDEVVSGQMQS